MPCHPAVRYARLFALLAAIAASPLAAQSPAQQQDDEIRRLQNILATLNQELIAQYEHFKAIQQAIRTNAETLTLKQQGKGPYPLSVDEATAASASAMQRESALTSQLEGVMARIKQIDERKQPILERLYGLDRFRAQPETGAQ
jgi:hypothetical protein